MHGEEERRQSSSVIPGYLRWERIFKTSLAVSEKHVKNEMPVIIFVHGNPSVSDGGLTLDSLLMSG